VHNHRSWIIKGYWVNTLRAPSIPKLTIHKSPSRAASILFAHEGELGVGHFPPFLNLSRRKTSLPFGLRSYKPTWPESYYRKEISRCQGSHTPLVGITSTQFILFKVTTAQADAADETAISGICDQALREEGRLDVFFANVRKIEVCPLYAILMSISQAGIASRDSLADTSVETFMNTMRVNALSFVHPQS